MTCEVLLENMNVFDEPFCCITMNYPHYLINVCDWTEAHFMGHNRGMYSNCCSVVLCMGVRSLSHNKSIPNILNTGPWTLFCHLNGSWQYIGPKTHLMRLEITLNVEARKERKGESNGNKGKRKEVCTRWVKCTVPFNWNKPMQTFLDGDEATQCASIRVCLRWPNS